MAKTTLRLTASVEAKPFLVRRLFRKSWHMNLSSSHLRVVTITEATYICDPASHQFSAHAAHMLEKNIPLHHFYLADKEANSLFSRFALKHTILTLDSSSLRHLLLASRPAVLTLKKLALLDVTGSAIFTIL